jgi:ribosomal-protein-alanine N-acetyltransferase
MDVDHGPAAPVFPILTTERLVLREITAEDAPFWLRNFSDPDVVEFTAYEPPADLEAAKAEIERYCTRVYREEQGIRWGISLKGSPDLIGTVGYHGWMPAGDRRAQMGYDLLAEFRGRGIMTEAMEVVLAYGFKTMTLNRAEALVDPRNTRSLRLMERLGFQRDAYLRQSTRFRDRYIDDVVFSLLAREWRATRGDKR